MNGWIGRSIDRWMDGWMDGWMEERNGHLSIYFDYKSRYRLNNPLFEGLCMYVYIYIYIYIDLQRFRIC